MNITAKVNLAGTAHTQELTLNNIKHYG